MNSHCEESGERRGMRKVVKIRRGDEWRGEKEEKKYVGLKSTDII